MAPGSICDTCKDWKGCIGKDWYHFGEIRWCPLQVLWILQNADTLRSGEWPQRDDNPDSIGNRQFQGEGTFAKPALIIAEVEARLAKCGLPGKLLMSQARAGDSIDTLEAEAWDALMYVKGWRRKTHSFVDWKRLRRFRGKHENETDIVSK